ncbi:hypothetical protein [Hymenobacter rigui]|uniref:Uncharacterized protein n=1 Tax=Hymenobacter rigui TaxID=334424 RepID=A0A428KK76_9BACT|nr:hypothetical protein [Hymenobacter rigui]RSK46838.1 hypothetical protein EI291_17485 [Hymenobacter rigui]
MKKSFALLALTALYTLGTLPRTATAQPYAVGATAAASQETYYQGFDAGREKRSEFNGIYSEGTRDFDRAVSMEYDRVQNTYIQGNTDPDSLDYWNGYLDGLTSAP